MIEVPSIRSGADRFAREKAAVRPCEECMWIRGGMVAACVCVWVIGWPRLVRRHSASALTFGASHAVQGTAEGENSKSSVVDLEKRDTQAQSSHSSFRSNSLRRWLAAYARQPGRTRFFFSLSNLGASFSAYGHEQTRDFSGTSADQGLPQK